MKPRRTASLTQKDVIQQKLRNWKPLRRDKVPPSGWIKAIRRSLGMTSKQLGRLLDVQQSTVSRLEQRETEGHVTLAVLGRVAEAMHCKLVYAIVPSDRYAELDDILRERARAVAETLVHRTEHSMRLEAQGTNRQAVERQVNQLAAELRDRADPRLWSPTTEVGRPK